MALAASWDPELAQTFGQIAAEELRSRGEHLLEAPGLNIARVPQNGRNFEYFGEDPLLTARLSIAEVRGIQAVGIIAEPKHYAANNQEHDRKTIQEVIDERTLREIYLSAFEATVKEADPGAIMCAYPSVDGQFSCENVHLLKEILRGDWGFQGFVQSDYTASRNAVANATAGLDLAMKPDHYDAEMIAAIASGQLSESVVDAMLTRRFTVMFRLGWFDHLPNPGPIPAQKDGSVAREIAEQSAVLLKNNGNQLPLDAAVIHSIALLGPYAGVAHTGGGGSSAVTPLYTVAPLEGLRKLAGSGVHLTYNDSSDPQAAASLAKSADVALVMVGNRDRENQDRTNLSLPEHQDDLVSAVAGANPHTVVVLKTGGPVLMPWLDQVSAVLEAWYPGEEDGNVVADLLFGRANPSGKLPLTFPKAAGDTPAHTPEQYPGVNGVATYSERLQVGYRWYDAQRIAPLFPFGFGLSYTSFEVHDLKLLGPRNGNVTVELDVTNTRQRNGTDVAQAYVAYPSGAGEPPKQLRGFATVKLRARETQHVTMTLNDRAFSVWDTRLKKWSLFPGRYAILVGDSSAHLPLRGEVTVPGPR